MFRFSKIELLHIFILFFVILLLGLLLTIAALPYYFIIKYLFSLYKNYLFLILLICIAYLTYGLTLGIVVSLFKRIFLLKEKEGRFRIGSFKADLWAFITSLIQLVRFVGNLELLRSTPFMNLYLRLMGAKIGKDVIVNTAKIYDIELIEIGDNTVIGGDVVLICHTAEGRDLIIKKIKIGKNVSIGQSTTILAGVEIEDNVTVGANSLVPKYMKLPANTKWGGVPIKQLK